MFSKIIFNPRIGRSFNLMVAILVFAIYYNWISFAQANLGQGRVGLPLALLLTHGLMAVIVAFVFRRQLSVHSLLGSVRLARSRSRGAPGDPADPADPSDPAARSTPVAPKDPGAT